MEYVTGVGAIICIINVVIQEEGRAGWLTASLFAIALTLKHLGV